MGNQLTLAHSRLWDAIGGFLYIFANMQDKLSKDPHQIELLRELMNLQKDMIIMLLSMLEGNVFNGPIGKQMVDTLIENQQNVEMLLKFFDIFLKMKDLTTSDAFREFDSNGDGWISPKEFKKAMEAQKSYTTEEIDYVLMCVDTNQDGKIDFNEFTARFHDPAKDIGFNMAVLLTNLSEHMSVEPRLDRLMKKASSFLAYFEPFLGRIEIQGSAGRIERVYFEIKESNIEQWTKPQIRESKRQFLFDIVNESDEKEKLENFVNFCEDTIFEMQHAASISPDTAEENLPPRGGHDQPSLFRRAFDTTKWAVFGAFGILSPAYIRSLLDQMKQSSRKDMLMFFFGLMLNAFFFSTRFVYNVIQFFFRTVYVIVSENQHAKVKPGEAILGDELIAEPLLTGTATPGSKPYGFSRAATVDCSDAENAAESAAAAAPSGREVEVYKLIDIEPLSNASIPITSEMPKIGSSSSSSSSPAAPRKIDYQKLLEEAASAEEMPAEGSKAAAAAAASASKPSNYKQLMSMFARSFYKMKYMALVLAFLINFLMMFYKARLIDPANPGVPVFPEPAAAAAAGDEDGAGAEEAVSNLIEVIMMDPDEYYIEHILKALAFIHSIVSFGMVVAYYVLKVPLVIFKREKEIARKLEFQGMWIAEQPGDDDLRSHWDKLVLSTRTYPEMYWDKFIKKKVKTKYQEQFDVDQLCKLMGISITADQFNADEMNASKAAAGRLETGLFSK